MRRRIAIMMLLGACFSEAGAQPQVVKPRAGFGRAVAFAGQQLLVGESQNEATPGFVYVYAKSGDQWVEQATLKAGDARAGDNFGTTIAHDANRIIIGARSAAYIFEKNASGWHQAARLAPLHVAAGDNFGAAVALSGDWAVIGASGEKNRAGAAYVFHRAGAKWVQEARLSAPDSKEHLLFGSAVAIKDGDVLVGEPNAANRMGGVHIFRKRGSAWKHERALVQSNAQNGDRFGSLITFTTHGLLISAPGSQDNTGAVLSFERAGDGSYREARRIGAPDARAGEQFGSAVAVDGAHLWVGAPFAAQSRGKIYHTDKAAPDAGVSDSLVFPNLKPGDSFGASLAAQGLMAAVGIPNNDGSLGTVVVYEHSREDRRWVPTVLQRSSSAIASLTRGKSECTGGRASGFDCQNVDLLSYVSAEDLGAARGMMMSSIWGWTDPETGKEWALVGRMDGTTFVDISNPEKPVVVGILPLTKGATPNLWREIKVYRNHVYIVADGAGPHGMQIFDLTRLRNVPKMPATFEADTTYRRVDSAHNIVINEESGFAYITGASGGGDTCGGGLHMLDIRDPGNPIFVGCFADQKTGRASTGYTHDALCVNYKGPDASYRGREICLGSNETMLSIADVTDKKQPRAIARSGYPNVGYMHQGWLSEDQRYFYVNDELDELAMTTPKTRTIIWDLADLDDPQVAGEFLSPTAASDHNLYIKGDTMYQSHYKAGVRIVDISQRTKPREIGYFDTMPYGDNNPGFGGSWGNYPFFKSGVIIATSMNEGLFVLQKRNSGKPVF